MVMGAHLGRPTKSEFQGQEKLLEKMTIQLTRESYPSIV